MSLARKTIAAAVLVLFATASEAVADSVVYEVRAYSAPGFSASWLHNAQSGAMAMPDGNTYYAGGTRVYSLAGEILADRDLGAGSIDFLGGNLAATSLGSSGTFLGVFDLSDDLVITVLGGSLQRTASGRPEGFLNTRLSQYGVAETVDVSFYYAPFDFSGPANSFLDADLLSFAVWGNNAAAGTTSPVSDSALRIGSDLYAQGTPTPEPATVVLLGSALTGGAAWRGRRRGAARR